MPITRNTFIVMLIGLMASLPAWAEEKPGYTPYVAPASDEGLRAIKQMRVPEPLRTELIAAEPLLANPVAFCIDHQGRFYVAETFRIHDGVPDIRGHMNWLDDDLASRTVADRDKMYRKFLGAKYETYGRDHDRVRRLVDRDGDGKLDHATVFADGFKNAVDGLGSGVFARGDRVWYTCIPSLWLLRDSKGTGQADVRQELSTGYGVHVGFIGHDLHGLTQGPDGKLYFSIGDRGLNVKTPQRQLFNPDSGAVLRCNPDGSDLEIFATGLRNPQELAFDEFGNLFTVDNNSDGGDRARLTHLVEGGDSGWRIGYQFLTWPGSRGPWIGEKMCLPQTEGQPAFYLPPLVNVADGPSGLVHHPGVAQLPAKYRGHFFLADFRGNSGQSGIRAFGLKPKGASFEMVGEHQFIWSILATDVDIGPDGGLYVSDWVNGWGKTGKGRIYRFADPALATDPAVLEVKKLLAEGMAKRPAAELFKLLGHADQRVRQEAQFALVDLGSTTQPSLYQTASTPGAPTLPRIHAIWALAQLQARTNQPIPLDQIKTLLNDADPEVRAQATKLAVRRDPALAERLVPLLKDPQPRVRFHAAQALAKVGGPLGPVLELLRANADQDPYLRHAAVMALLGSNDAKGLEEASKDRTASVRLGVLLAWRRQENPALARFLADPDERLVLEAARAINDVGIEGAQPQLARLIARRPLPDPLGLRVLNANFRLGQPANAVALADFAGRTDVSATLQLEALKMLADWEKPSGRDRVIGLWRPLAPRAATVARDALQLALGSILRGSDKVRQEAVRLAARLGIKEVGPALLALLQDVNQGAEVRAEALGGLEALKDARLEEATRQALKDKEPRVRSEARRVLAVLRPGEAASELANALSSGEVREQQAALTALGMLKDPRADAILGSWLDKLQAKTVAPSLQLELLEAAGKRNTTELKRKLETYEANRAQQPATAKFNEALAGGTPEEGKKVFRDKAEVYCLRCHKIDGNGGEVGPDLTGIGGKQTREYLLESLLEPNRQIAKGFETVVLATTRGQLIAGIVKSEDDKEVRLMNADGKLIAVPKKDIEERQSGKSAMPEDVVNYLSRRELRDLVEYLSSLK